MKKIQILLFLLLTSFLLVSCGWDNTKKVEVKQETKKQVNVEKKDSNLNKESDKNNKEEKKQKEDNTISLTPEQKVLNESYSSFKKSELEEKVKTMKDSPEKVAILTKLLKYKQANELNKKLIQKLPIEKFWKLNFQIIDFDWNFISNAKVTNLLTKEVINTDNSWKAEFSEKVLKNTEVPVFIEKQGYSSYIAYLNPNKELSKVTLKKAEQKEINYNWEETTISFDNKSEVILPSDWVIIEWTKQKYTWKIKAELTAYSKQEVLKNETLRESLTRAVLANSSGSVTVWLETFWMIDVNLYSDKWEKLNINNKATIKIPVSDVEWAKKAFWLEKSWKTKDGFWYLNKDTWVWENYPDWYFDIEKKLYIAKVPHFSNYNMDHLYTWYWWKPTFSTTKKVWRNWKNKVTATITFHHIRVIDGSNTDDWETLTHTFTKNWTWYAQSKNSTKKAVSVTWFSDDKTPPSVNWEIK